MNYYINQIGKKDCAFASLKMLFAKVFNKKDFLFYPQDILEKELSLKDVIKIAHKEGIELKGVRYLDKNEIFNDRISNSLVLIKLNNALHMVFLRKINRKYVYFNDPKYGIIKILKPDFLHIWTGDILLIQKYYKCKKKINKIKKT